MMAERPTSTASSDNFEHNDLSRQASMSSSESHNQDLIQKETTPRTSSQTSSYKGSAQKELSDASSQKSDKTSDQDSTTRKTASAASSAGPKADTPTATKSPRTSTVSVTIVDHRESNSETKPKRVSSGRRRMERELERMKETDENARLRLKAKRKEEVEKAIAALYDQKKKEGVTLTQDVESSRVAIRTMMRDEERMALEKEQKKLRQETKAIQDEIDDKYGLKDKKEGHDLMALAENFYHGKMKDGDGLPEKVRRTLTAAEIEDLRMVFEMFDVKGRGYIVANDVKRAASMLGFKARKEVFTEMIREVTGDKNAKVTFVHFLQFVVKGQGDGDDPLEDIMQCFRMLDSGQKGYLTADDLRNAADTQKVPLSNRAIREMIQEADVTGDAKVTSDEFIHIMLQSSMFRATR